MNLVTSSEMGITGSRSPLGCHRDDTRESDRELPNGVIGSGSTGRRTAGRSTREGYGP